MRALITLLALSILPCAALATNNAAHILKLPLTGNLGATPQTVKFPDGTVLSNTRFYASEQSGLSVGRTQLNGPRLPKETIGYTDVFYIVHGSGTGLNPDGTTIRLRQGDLMLLPRGTTIEAHDFHHYVHFFASFETQKDAVASGPLGARLLHPQQLRASDFTQADGLQRHTYYEGRGGVLVQAVRYPDHVNIPAAENAVESQLLFIVAGTGSIREKGMAAIVLKPESAILVPKGAMYSLTADHLLTVAIRFERSTP